MDKMKIEIQCPCCQARLIVDGTTGTVLWHEDKRPEKNLPSMNEMIKNLETRKKEVQEKIFNESKALKERPRILEEKFKESMKRLDKNEDIKPIGPFDLD
jgi:flagellar basal body P-ring protein FlgI